MQQTDTGGPAFPHEWFPASDGMTLRDYFAAKAMQAMIISADKRSRDEAELWVGSIAYEIADNMLEARAE